MRGSRPECAVDRDELTGYEFFGKGSVALHERLDLNSDLQVCDQNTVIRARLDADSESTAAVAWRRSCVSPRQPLARAGLPRSRASAHILSLARLPPSRSPPPAVVIDNHEAGRPARTPLMEQITPSSSRRPKAMILCGGQGTRIRDVADDIPKPMVRIGDRPILWHIMQIYARYGITEFVLCLGYKGWTIKEFFLNYRAFSTDLSVHLGPQPAIEFHGEPGQ